MKKVVQEIKQKIKCLKDNRDKGRGQMNTRDKQNFMQEPY